jgi:oligosaccharide repeat unit polymerase
MVMWHPVPWNLLYAIDLFAIVLFALSYYRKCYRHGYRIDFWHSSLFLMCVLPNMIMLPFARSELNRIVLGGDFAAVMASLPTVFLITIVGYSAVLVGGALWRLQIGVGLRKAATQVLDVVPRCSMMLMSSRRVLIFQSTLCVLLQVFILALYFSQSGFAFDLRGFTFANPTLRPVALIISNYSVTIASHCLARYADKKERLLLACTLILSVGLVFFGTRANLIAIYISVLMCHLMKLRSNLSFFRMFALIAFITVVGFYLGLVRAGAYSLGDFFASLVFLLFYGNNFSDLRDFAWVYSAWNHVFWGGKTYLVAILSFIPRFAWQFRDTWGLGVMTTTTVGFDPNVHTGLRPGQFGEGFFNFGLPGVVIVGLVLGVIFRRVDIDTRRALAASQPSIMKAFASTMLLGVAGSLAVTAGFSSVYALAGIYFLSWLCLCVERMFHPRRIAIERSGSVPDKNNLSHPVF